MKVRIWGIAFGILSLCLISATVLPSVSPVFAQTFGCGMGRGVGCGPAGVSVNPQEQSDYNAFNNDAVVETKIALGEQFVQKYPKSRYQEQVDTSLSFLYFNKGDYTKFYAASYRALATNPKSIPILELVGWVIPRDYNANNPTSAANLDEAEKYEKRALTEIAAMKKPRQVTQSEFQNSKSSLEWRAHSGLGTVYFRRKDYAASAAELQTAIKQQGTEPDPSDLYVLGVDLEHLGRMTQAADEFSQCSASATSGMQEQCQKAYEAASHAAVESVEEKAYDAFNNAPNAKAQLQLGEKFDQTYPSSPYRENIDSALLTLYEDEPDWAKFYATANTILEKDPDNVPVLALVGWVIPRHDDATGLAGADRLTEAEQYEKHALALIATMRKPADLSENEFEQAKANTTLRAHSGLGAAYFRLGDYSDAAAELQIATADKNQADPWDFYIFGTSLHKMKRDQEAIGAFENCAAVSGYLQQQCARDVAAVSSVLSTPQSAQLATLTAKSPAPATSQPGANDIPLSTARETAPPIRAETVIVPVRVVVRDNKGRAVSDLKKEDFKLYQDGKQQDIANFTVVSRHADATASAMGNATASSMPSAPALSSSANVSAASVSATRFIVLFFDDAHLYFADLVQTRTAAEKYTSTLQPEDRVAIVTASGQGETQFTSDHEELHASLEKLQPHPFPGGPGGTAGAFPCPPPMTYLEADAIANSGATSDKILGIAAADIANCVRAPGDFTGEARGIAEQAHVANEEAVDAIFEKLKTEIRRMSVLPGDRAVVLVSPGFVYGGHERTFADLTDLAIRSNVVINALDAKGVYGTSPRDRSGMPTDKWDPDRFLMFGYNHAMEDAVLEDLADSTGGLFIHFDNDFVGSMREMSEPPESYYLLGYAPQNLQSDGKFHVIKVSLSSGTHGSVQARRGFFAPSHLETPEEAARREIDDAMFSNDLQHDLPIKLETSIIRDTSGEQEVGVKAHIDVSHLHFAKTDTTNQENLTVAAALFDSDGNYVTGTQKIDRMNLDDTTLAQLEKAGFYIEVDLRAKPGKYVVRMVARDSNDGHISAENANVTIPN